MTPRERQLAIVVLGLLGLLLVWSGWGKLNEAYETRQVKIDALRSQIHKKELQVETGRQAKSRRVEYRRRSLPANRELALFQYRSWLRQSIDRAGWKEVDLTPQQSPARRGVYERLAFNITAQVTLTSLTNFLYTFYQTDHLHQIRRLELKPDETGKELELTMQVEALSLPDAVQKENLDANSKSPRALSPQPEYVKSIAGRNLFAGYVAPPPPPAKSKPPAEKLVEQSRPAPMKPSFDDAKFAYVTGILQDAQGQPQVWVKVRTTGETLKLRAGEGFRLGSLQGSVVRIDARQVVISLDEQHLLVTLGESVREGILLPPDGL